MKKLAVVFLTLGVIAVIVGLFPGLIGLVAKPQPGFGLQQRIAVGIGIVLFAIGALMCGRCGKCCACAPPESEPDEEPEEEKIEPPSK